MTTYVRTFPVFSNTRSSAIDTADGTATTIATDNEAVIALGTVTGTVTSTASNTYNGRATNTSYTIATGQVC
jgi:hypothetical protein